VLVNKEQSFPNSPLLAGGDKLGRRCHRGEDQLHMPPHAAASGGDKVNLQNQSGHAAYMEYVNTQKLLVPEDPIYEEDMPTPMGCPKLLGPRDCIDEENRAHTIAELLGDSEVDSSSCWSQVHVDSEKLIWQEDMSASSRLGQAHVDKEKLVDDMSAYSDVARSELGTIDWEQASTMAGELQLGPITESLLGAMDDLHSYLDQAIGGMRPSGVSGKVTSSLKQVASKNLPEARVDTSSGLDPSGGEKLLRPSNGIDEVSMHSPIEQVAAESLPCPSSSETLYGPEVYTDADNLLSDKEQDCSEKLCEPRTYTVEDDVLTCLEPAPCTISPSKNRIAENDMPTCLEPAPCSISPSKKHIFGNDLPTYSDIATSSTSPSTDAVENDMPTCLESAPFSISPSENRIVGNDLPCLETAPTCFSPSRNKNGHSLIHSLIPHPEQVSKSISEQIARNISPARNFLEEGDAHPCFFLEARDTLDKFDKQPFTDSNEGPAQDDGLAEAEEPRISSIAAVDSICAALDLPVEQTSYSTPISELTRRMEQLMSALLPTTPLPA
jgi:hypothetical protein